MDFEELVNDILVYESDTFSASGIELNHEQAYKMAQVVLEKLVGNHMDGVMLDLIFEDLFS